MKKIRDRRKASDRNSVCLEATPRNHHLGRWLLFSASAVSAVSVFARWVASERRERSMQLVPLTTQTDALTVITPETMPSRNRTAKRPTATAGKKSKLAQAYDAALPTPPDPDRLPTDGREGERRTQQSERQSNINAGKRKTMTPPNVEITDLQPTATQAQAFAAPVQNMAETSASTTESKMSIGEEIRDREFPVPDEKTGGTSRRLVVDQETMSDSEPGMGGAIGAVPGDTQPKGIVGDIMDEDATTPDFAQQR